MEAFARPLPSLAFFDLAIHAPAEDLERVAHLASRSSTPNATDARECWLGLYGWIKEFIAQRRGKPPRGDVVDAVLNASVDGRPLTEDEIIGTVQLLILGGLETTAGALGLMLVRFCHRPEIPALLRSKPELIPSAVQELLRLDPSFVSVRRTALRDNQLGRHPIQKGGQVAGHLGSGQPD